MEPTGALAGGSGGSLQDLYEAAYPRLVGLVGAVARDQHEAEKAVQDAFVRLMRQWDRVSRYDDPEGTVTSRLSRARAALAPALREDLSDV